MTGGGFGETCIAYTRVRPDQRKRLFRVAALAALLR
jgi:hypothetical protein